MRDSSSRSSTSSKWYQYTGWLVAAVISLGWWMDHSKAQPSRLASSPVSRIPVPPIRISSSAPVSSQRPELGEQSKKPRSKIARERQTKEELVKALKSQPVETHEFLRRPLGEIFEFLCERAGISPLEIPDTQVIVSCRISASPYEMLETIANNYGLSLDYRDDAWRFELIQDNELFFQNHSVAWLAPEKTEETRQGLEALLDTGRPDIDLTDTKSKAVDSAESLAREPSAVLYDSHSKDFMVITNGSRQQVAEEYLNALKQRQMKN